MYLRKRERMCKRSIPFIYPIYLFIYSFIYHSWTYVSPRPPNYLTDENRTEHKPLSCIIKVSWFPSLLTLTAEETRQIYSLWHSNQLPRVFLRVFNNMSCPRAAFMNHQCVSIDSFWPPNVSLPSFISSLLTLQCQN